MTKEIALRISVKGQKELTKATANVNKLVNERKKLNKALKTGSINQSTYDKAIGRNNVTLKAARTNVNRLNKEILINNRVMKKGRGLVGSMTKGFSAMAMRLGVAYLGFAALSKIVGSAMSIITNFDKANSKLRAILGKTREEMDTLKESAKAYGSVTAFTATQVAELQTALAKLGFTENQILNMTQGVLDLAAAADTDLANAAEITGSTLRAFGLKAEETNRVVDVMAKAFSTSALDIEKFKIGMEKVAPVAKAVGVDLEETSAILGTLANAGLEASTSGTSLRNIFLQLAKHGITWEEAQTKMAAATDRVNEGQKLFGKRGVTAALIVMDMQAEIETLTDAYHQAAGASGEMALAQLDNLVGDKLLLSSAWEGFILSVDEGDGMISRFTRNLTGYFTDLVNSFQMMNEGALDFSNAFESTEKREKRMADWRKKQKEDVGKIVVQTEAEIALEKKKAEIAEKYNKLLEKYNLEEEENDNKKSKRAKDLAQKKLDLLKAEEKAVLDLKAAQDEADANEMASYNEFLLTKAELEQAYYDSLLTQEQRELNAIEDKYFAIIEMATKNGEDITALTKAKEAEILQVTTDANERRKENNAQTDDEIKEKREQTYNDMMAFASFYTDLLGEMGQRRTTEATKHLDEQLESGQISQEQYDRKKESLERQAFNRKKRLDIASVIINFATANSKALAEGFWVGLAAIPLLTGMMMTQIALIASQKFAQGGLVGGGIFEGKSHAQGGIKFSSGGRLMEAEGGEAIINRRSTAMFRPQLSAMNAAGGGVTFADGGILNQLKGNFDMAGQSLGVGEVVVVESSITDTQNTVSNIQSTASI